MAPTLINSTVILNDIITRLPTECVSLQAINRDYDKQFAKKSGLKPGTTLYARKPVEYTVTSGKKMDVQDTVEESIPITCTDQYHIALPAFTSEQLTMNISDFRKRYIDPAVSRLRALLDTLILQYAAIHLYQNVGAPGTTPQTSLVLGQAGAKLDNMNVQMDNRTAILNPAANIYIVDALKALQNPQNQIGGQLKDGILKTTYGLGIGKSSNVHRITCGTRVGTILVDESPNVNIEEGMTTIHMDGFTNAADTIVAGEKFTLSGVYAVNPESKVSTGELQQFTVTAAATCSSNETDVTFTPAIRYDDARQNVTALPADGATVTFAGTASTTYPMNLVLHKDAMTLVTADLPLPKGCHDAYRTNYKGLAMRYITDYNMENDEFASRIDIFMGISMLEARRGVVLWG
jgi:hypothetical protein